MTTAQYLLNLGLLAFVLLSALGTRRVTPGRFALPVALVAVAAVVFLREPPTAGHDVQLQLIGAGAGALLGVVTGALVRVGHDDAGRLVWRAGAAYAAVWVLVVGGRMLFAYGAEHWFPAAIGRFSMAHQITGAEAWTSAFILMALTMVLARVVVSGVLTAKVARAARVTQA